MRPSSIRIYLKSTVLLLAAFGLIAYISRYMYSERRLKSIRPNILLITVCSLRQDHLSCYGYPRLTTPNIDKLVKFSTVFTNCYTPVPWTIPSIEALMTGTYPFSSLGLTKKTSLIKLLRSSDYAMSGIVGTFVENSDFNCGFDRFFGPRNLKTNKDINTVSADVISHKAIEILASSGTNKRNPIFLWVFFKDPHWPYLPAGQYRERFLNDQLYYNNAELLKINEDFHDSIGGIGEARLEGADGKFVTNKAYYIAQYDAEILFADKYIGEILDYIKNSGHFEDWVIILSADHGESLGEDNYFFDHGYKLSECLVKIPLIIKFPGQDKKILISETVSIRDIYSIIVDLLGLKDPAGMINKTNNEVLYKRLSEWLSNRKNLPVMIGNSPYHERKREILLGCVWNNYKLIWDRSNNRKNFYSLSGKERLIGKCTVSCQAIIDRYSKLINDFFGTKDTNRTDDIEKIRSLGYL